LHFASFQISWRSLFVCVCVFFCFSRVKRKKFAPPVPQNSHSHYFWSAGCVDSLFLLPSSCGICVPVVWGAWNLHEFFFLSFGKKSQSVEVFSLEKQTHRDEDRDRD
jgi:hypothetical protein